MGAVNRLYDYDGAGERWEDLRFPATGISIGALTSPPDVDPATGLLLFDGTTTVETIGILAQMPHAWKEGTVIRPHVHWRKTTDAAGGVTWTLRYKWFNNGDLEGAWSSVINGTLVSALDPGATQQSTISVFGDIDATDKRLSSLFLCQVGRLYTDAGDTYEADSLLYEFDIHYIKDSRGSLEEFAKPNVLRKDAVVQ